MNCSKCGHEQLGGMYCSQCGKKLRKQQTEVFTSTEERSKRKSGRFVSPSIDAPVVEQSTGRDSKRYTATSKKSELPPPPEAVKRKIKERSKFQRKGLNLLYFWVSNLVMRSLESVLFFGIFHLGVWALLMIGNFFGGLVAPEAEIPYTILMIDRMELYMWEWISFVVITIFTFRKRWGT